MDHVESSEQTAPGEKGQDLAEYALLVALIATVCVTAVRTLGTTVAGVFGNISFT